MTKADAPEQYMDVTSSNIAQVGWNPDKDILGVRFQNGTEYLYSGASLGLYEEFLVAESAGAFFAKNVRGKYEYARIR